MLLVSSMNIDHRLGFSFIVQSKVRDRDDDIRIARKEDLDDGGDLRLKQEKKKKKI